MPRFFGRFVIGAGALLIAATAQAQGPSNAPARPWKIGGALGGTIPLGDFSDNADLGWHLGGLFEYKQPSLPVTWRGEVTLGQRCPSEAAPTRAPAPTTRLTCCSSCTYGSAAGAHRLQPS